MELDFNNPTVQVAFIAAVAAVATATFSLLAALITAFVTLLNHVFEARTKRLERIKDVRSEKAQQLLEGVAEMHANLSYHLQSIGFLKMYLIFLLLESEGSTQAERFVRFKDSMESSAPGVSENQRVEFHMKKDLRSLFHWLDPKIISSLFWFPKPLQLKGKLETLIGEFQGVYMLMATELETLSEIEEQIYENPEIPTWLNKKVLGTAENKLLKKWQDKAFKTVLEVQRLLAPHMR